MFNFFGNKKKTTETKKSSLIYCGSYGCVIRPAYLCNNTFSKDLNLVSKIFINKKYWEEEIELNLKVLSHDTENNFTIQMINYCEFIYTSEFINSVNIDEKKDKGVFNYLKENDKAYQIIYEYGGINLYELLTKKEYLDKIKDINVVDFFKKFVNIFEGVKLLNSKNLYHSDIKPDNVLFNIDKNKFNLIDFGFITDINNVYNLHSINMFNGIVIDFYPNEFNILAYIIFNSDIDETKDIKTDLNFNSLYKNILENLFIKIINKYKNKKNQHLTQILSLMELINKKKDNLKDILIIYSDFIKKFKKDKSLLLEVLTNSDYYFLKNDIIQNKAEDIILSKNIDSICNSAINIKSKIDVYMLGITLLFMVLSIYINFNEKNGIFDIPLGLFDLIAHMIDLNPCSRFTMEASITQYNLLFKDL